MAKFRPRKTDNTLLLVGLLCVAAFLVYKFYNREGFNSDSPSSITNGTVVLFYSKTCGHCSKLEPVWDQITAKYGSKVLAIDCTTPTASVTAAMNKYSVTAYPTILCINATGNATPYTGDKTLADLSSFIDQCTSS
jgi:thiol-disulfide isomerase/thioredoxin